VEVLGEAGGLGWTLEVVQYAKLGSRQVPALRLFGSLELRTDQQSLVQKPVMMES